MATVTISVAPSQQSVTPLWFANHEAGNFNEWSEGAGGGVFNSGSWTNVISTEQAHGGTRSVKASINSSRQSGVRLFRWEEPRTGQDLYYSSWFYFPVKYTVSGWWNIVQFKTKTSSRNDPTWVILVDDNGAGGAMRLYCANHWNGSLFGNNPRTFDQTLNPTDLPVGRWVHIEAWLHQATVAQNNSRLQVWQDGVQIFDLAPGLPSKYNDGDQQWSINNYGQSLTPNPTVLYMDDAVIATQRVFGKTVVGL